MEFLTMSNFDFKNKRVLIRVDLNSPYNPRRKKITTTRRLRWHARTIRELAKKHAKVVVLSHQGRKGKKDFISLRQHAKILSKFVGRKVKFVNDVVGEKAILNIKKLKSGRVLLLENVRFLEDETLKLSIEEHAKSKLVKRLSKLFDFYILDAFSVSHRPHASVVGFAKKLPCVVGRVLENEIVKNSEAFEYAEHPYVLVLGGIKVEDYIDLIDYAIKSNKFDKILACGCLGELCLLAKGYKLGKKEEFLKEIDLLESLPKIKKFVKSEKIELPVDLAVAEKRERKEIGLKDLPTKNKIWDIGSKTIEKYTKIISEAKTVYLKGPCGYYEKKNFNLGTKSILQAIAESKAFSLAGGGHTLATIQKFIGRGRISHISLAGGALSKYIAGKKLPGVEALRKSAKIFS